MTICAGVSCAIRITWTNIPYRALMADTLIGPHSHLSYRVLLEIFSGYLMPMTCLSWRLWNESKRAHSAGVNPHVPMLYVSTRTIKAMYSLRRSPSDMLRFFYPRRPQSLESHCSKLLSSCHVFDIPQQWAEFACFSPLFNILRVSSVNVGVICFRFIDDEMPFQTTIRRESLDFI